MRPSVRIMIVGAALIAVGCSDTGPPRVGCLQKGEKAGTYVLTPLAEPLATAEDSAAPTGQDSPRLSVDGTAVVAPRRSYRVVADRGADLSRYLNQRVAVRGFVEDDTVAIATGTAGPWQNGTGAGYGAPNFQASPATIGDGSSSQIGTDDGTVGTSGYAATNGGTQTVDRVRNNRSTDPTSGGGIVATTRDRRMATLLAESISKVADSCIESRGEENR
jgi:hypothetical protein